MLETNIKKNIRTKEVIALHNKREREIAASKSFGFLSFAKKI